MIGDYESNGELLDLKLISKDAGIIQKTSRVYETEPWGLLDQPAYYNQVIELKTQLNARNLLKALLQIEKKMGRERTKKWARAHS